jgi:hypothetical protein
MNREALPFIGALLVPIILVGIIILYFYGFDLTKFFRQIDLIYYIVLSPIALGLFLAILHYRKPE